MIPKSGSCCTEISWSMSRCDGAGSASRRSEGPRSEARAGSTRGSLAQAWPSSSGAPSSTRSRDGYGHHRVTWTATRWTMTNGHTSFRPRLCSTVLLAEDLASYRQHFQSYLGAPAAGLREQIERGLRYGARDYLRPRAEMYRALADFWDGFAVDTGRSRPVADRAAASAAWYRRLAASQSARASIHDARVGRAKRALRALRLVATGVYRSPIAGGVGARALIGDILELIGPAQAAPIEISQDVAARILRARAAGSRPEAVAEELSREKVPPPYGRRWSVAMVRDLGFQHEREVERAAAATSAVGASSRSIEGPPRQDQERPSA